MKVIDLLNKIANGEKVPERIMYKGIEWKYNDRQYYRVDEAHTRNIWSGYNFNILDDKVEIIEEDKKIKKLEVLNTDFYDKECCYEGLTKEEITLDIQTLKQWINEIIDYLEEKE